MNKFLVDLAIPTLNEKGYIEHTLASLADQTLYKKDKVHIIIGDYKDQLNIDDYYLMNLCKDYKHVTYLPIFQKGIAAARNKMISDASLTDIIMNFDGDSRFNRPDAIEMMIHPIINKEVVLTNCETILIDNITGKKSVSPNNWYEFASSIGSSFERFLVARGPGLTVDKETFWGIGGFRDVPVGEDYFLGWDICYKHSIHAKRYIDKVKVLTSDRRSKAIEKDGINIFDYTRNSYR